MTLTTNNSGNTFTGNSLQGVKNAEGLTAANPSTTYVLNKKTAGVGFYKLRPGKTAGVGKAYLTYNAPATTAPDFIRFEDEEDNATNLSKFSNDSQVTKFIINGQLYLLRDGITYDALGNRIK